LEAGKKDLDRFREIQAHVSWEASGGS
jgi:hypothetical protein